MVNTKYLTISVWFVQLALVATVYGAIGSGAKENLVSARIWPSSQERFFVKKEGLSHALAQHPASIEPTMNIVSAPDAVVKSRGRAFLMSLLLPGWGQHYAGSKTMMKIFAVTEALTWGSYLGLNRWGNWLEDDSRTFAATHAGVNSAAKPGIYFVDIGRFDDIIAYNQAQLRDRDVADLYPESEDFFWRWDNDENRTKYDDIRKRSARALNRSEFAVAAIFVNHVVSAIHSTLAVYKSNKRQAESKVGFKFKLDGTSPNSRVMLSLTKRF